MANIKAYGPYVAMVVVQFSCSGIIILMKISLEQGLSQLIFVVYRHLIAMLVLAPFAYLLERKQRPPLSFGLVIKIFVLASLGTTVYLNIYYAGLHYVSPTVAIALSNAIPGLTFLLAVLFRMEKVKLESNKGRAKVLGTLASMGGALIFTFWKGKTLFKGFGGKTLIDIHLNDDKASIVTLRHGKNDWVKGSALILISDIAWSAWLLLQAVICEAYPAQISLNTLICFFASLQSSVLALFLERKPILWRLGWNLQLLTIVYAGVVHSALGYYLQTWSISKKGPVFAAMFSPLQLIIGGLFSAVVFAERLHLGSLIGVLFIVPSLYFVLWGKSKDTTCVEEKPCSEGKSSPDHDQTLQT